MRTFLLHLSLLFVPFFGFSQSIMPFQDWTTVSGTQNFFIRSVVDTDPDANIYIAGATVNSLGNYDILVSKYESTGELVWVHQYAGAGNGDDIATAIEVNDDGMVAVTGISYVSSSDSNDIITLFYDSDGSLEWANEFGGAGTSNDGGTSITIYADSIYVGGFIETSGNGYDYKILKYNFAGSLLWDTTFDYDNEDDVPTSIIEVNSTTLILGGATQVSLTDWDFLLVEIEAVDGTVIGDYVDSGGSAGFDEVKSVVKDNLGNIYIVGKAYSGTTGYDIYTAKLSSSLSLVWDDSYHSSGSQNDVGNCIAVDGVGNVYVSGYSESPSEITNYTTIKYNSSGTQQWVKTWDGDASGADSSKAIVILDDGIVVTGVTSTTQNTDFHTIKYDFNGNEKWGISFNNVNNLLDNPSSIAETNDGGIVVTGQSLLPNNTMEYTTVKYLELEITIPVDSDSVAGSIVFVENRGQLLGSDGNVADRVQYQSHLSEPSTFYMEDTISIVIYESDSVANDSLQRIDMWFDSELTSKLLPLEKQEYYCNYYRGHMNSGRPNVPVYGGFYRSDVWNGIDVYYSSNSEGLKYYFIIDVDRSSDSISIGFSGQDSLKIDGGGALNIYSRFGTLQFPRARVFQADDDGDFSGLGWQPEYEIDNDRITFSEMGSYDDTRKLFISFDQGLPGELAPPPCQSLIWSVQVGFTGSDYILDVDRGYISTDSGNGGDLFVAGKTRSEDFAYGTGISPVSGQGGFVGKEDGLVVRFNAGKEAKWFSYIGGNNHDAITGIAFIPGLTTKLGFAGTQKVEPY